MGLEGVELAMDVEETFGIRLSETETSKVITVGEIVELAWSKVKDRGDETWTKSKVREAVHQHVRENLGITSCQDSDRLIEDLGMQ